MNRTHTFLLTFVGLLYLAPYVLNHSPKWNAYEYHGPAKLKFEGCNRNGWTCVTSSDEMRITFNCPKDFEEKNQIIKWTFEGLPPLVRSVIIQNCNLMLEIDEEANFKLNRFIVRNITEVSFVPRRHEFYLKAKKNKTYENRISVMIIDSIKFIKSLIFGTIWGRFDEISIRKCKIDSLEWHAFHHINASLFDFTENEVNVVKEGAFNLVANRVNIVGNTFNYLQNGAFFDIAIGDIENEHFNYSNPSDSDDMYWKPIIQFESNTIYKSEVGGLHFGRPISYIVPLINTMNTTNDGNSTTAIPKYNISVRNNQFNCRPKFIKWLYDVFVDPDEEKEKIRRLQEVRKVYFDKTNKFIMFYVIEYEDNVCYNLDCKLSLGLYTDRYFIYGPNRNICDDNLEFNSTFINGGGTLQASRSTIVSVIFNLIVTYLFILFNIIYFD